MFKAIIFGIGIALGALIAFALRGHVSGRDIITAIVVVDALGIQLWIAHTLHQARRLAEQQKEDFDELVEKKLPDILARVEREAIRFGAQAQATLQEIYYDAKQWIPTFLERTAISIGVRVGPAVSPLDDDRLRPRSETARTGIATETRNSDETPTADH